jgi:hypothetical protein
MAFDPKTISRQVASGVADGIGGVAGGLSRVASSLRGVAGSLRGMAGGKNPKRPTRRVVVGTNLGLEGGGRDLPRAGWYFDVLRFLLDCSFIDR